MNIKFEAVILPEMLVRASPVRMVFNILRALIRCRLNRRNFIDLLEVVGLWQYVWCLLSAFISSGADTSFRGLMLTMAIREVDFAVDDYNAMKRFCEEVLKLPFG